MSFEGVWFAYDQDVTANTPDNDDRWILPGTDPIGNHPWYRSQSRERQIEIGMWRQANVAKVGLHFENILIRGLMEYSFWVPNGSPEYRYCLHEAVEECNHTLMFQEMVNRIGKDVPGMPRLLKWPGTSRSPISTCTSASRICAGANASCCRCSCR